jgi:hypothetical protein
MKLQGRNLEPNLREDDIKLLQSKLRQLKLKAGIVDPEGFLGSTNLSRRSGIPAKSLTRLAISD